MGRIFITSDLHFNHDKEFIYKARGFENIDEHDQAIVSNWNSLISDEDTVYLLGDVMLSGGTTGIQYLSQLNGQIHIIQGNHDSDCKIEAYLQLPNIVEVMPALYLKYQKCTFYLSHYPTLTPNFTLTALKNSVLNLYGHTHQATNFYEINGKPHPYMYHVGVDSHALTPVLLDDIIEEIKHQLSFNDFA